MLDAAPAGRCRRAGHAAQRALWSPCVTLRHPRSPLPNRSVSSNASWLWMQTGPSKRKEGSERAYCCCTAAPSCSAPPHIGGSRSLSRCTVMGAREVAGRLPCLAPRKSEVAPDMSRRSGLQAEGAGGLHGTSALLSCMARHRPLSTRLRLARPNGPCLHQMAMLI